MVGSARVYPECQVARYSARDDKRSTKTARRVCAVIHRRQHDGQHCSIWWALQDRFIDYYKDWCIGFWWEVLQGGLQLCTKYNSLFNSVIFKFCITQCYTIIMPLVAHRIGSSRIMFSTFSCMHVACASGGILWPACRRILQLLATFVAMLWEWLGENTWLWSGRQFSLRSRPMKTWTEILWRNCPTWHLNKTNAINCSKWWKVIKEILYCS